MLSEAGGTASHPLRGIVHLWNLDLAPLDDARADVDREDLLGTGSVLHLVQALATSGQAGKVPLHVVTRGAQVVREDEPAGTLRPRAAGSWGLAGVVRAEFPELRIRVLDLDPREGTSTPCAGLLDELLAPGRGPDELALREGQRWLPRLGPYRASHAMSGAPTGLHLALVRPGTLDGVELRPVTRRALRPDEVRLDVLACGLNFRDVLVTLGMYPGDPVPLGAECAGIVTEVGAGVRGLAVGERVFAFAPDSLGTECTVAADFVRAIPAGMSPADAAALPVAFLTACYGLHRLAGLGRGERVLIHAAAGGVGLAAVQLALRRGAEVFATAGSEEKRERLRAMGVAHVLDSRSLGFADEILARTAGAGVHVVLNSLAADFIPATLRALGPSGRFLEIGKRGILSAEQAARERPDVAYHAFDLGAVVQADRPLLRSMLDEILAAFADGSLHPLPVTTFPMDDVRDALRFMAQARHIGKIVVLPKAAGVASPWCGVSSEGTYWITGGLGALGIETARWLAGAGARHLVLSGRRPPGAAAARVIGELEGQGVEVRVFASDAADAAQARAVLAQVDAGMPPLRGIVHAAGILRDGVLHRQRWEDCRDVLRGKAHGAWVLHALTRERPLDFFVLYSAAGLLLGAPGQGAYPAANAELDALARARRRLGLTALSVAWGAWAGAGMAVEQAAQGRDVWAERGLRPIVPEQGFAMLERLLREDAVHAAVLPIHWGRFLAQLPPSANRDFFAAVAPQARAPRAADSAPASVPSRLRALPLGQRRDALVAHLAERALHVLGLDPATRVEPGTPLKEIGLDSLMAVELRNALGRSLGEALPATLLFDYPTLEALSAFLARVIDLEIEAPRETATAEAGAALAAKARLAALSDEEAEALLLAELDAGAREGRV
ncbi:MAG: SDR family NAD(P)-dependent oxidoreductase [Betaproteobacteria bacterium]|nr:SDR family NAD(P)-dependent oxidoreductase [Betaproteobacteria bacterium]